MTPFLDRRAASNVEPVEGSPLFFSSWESEDVETFSENSEAPSHRLYAGRAVGRDRDHRRPGRPALARRAIGARSGSTDAVPKQSQAVRLGAAQSYGCARQLSAGLPVLRRVGQPLPDRWLAAWAKRNGVPLAGQSLPVHGAARLLGTGAGMR